MEERTATSGRDGTDGPRLPLRLRLPGVVLLALLVGLAGGCVRRTLSITSDPAGAAVFLNDREVGRTPVEVDFTYYGTYDVRLVRDGCEPYVGSAEAKAPLWDTVPLDLFSELVPADMHSRIDWHFTLAPLQDEGLVERASEMRRAAEAEGGGPSGASEPSASPASR